eukprot:8816985-Karenia_brevis.AAC.1
MKEQKNHQLRHVFKDEETRWLAVLGGLLKQYRAIRFDRAVQNERPQIYMDMVKHLGHCPKPAELATKTSSSIQDAKLALSRWQAASEERLAEARERIETL